MVDASPDGTLYVTFSDDSLKISISPISSNNDSLKVYKHHNTIYTESLRLQPMQVYHKTIPVPQGKTNVEDIRVNVGKNRLVYSSAPERIIDRPMVSPVGQEYHSAERFFRLGEDENAMRNYKSARHYYLACLETEPTHRGALTRMAELYYRQGQYAEGLRCAEKVLETDTYHGGANYIYGVLQRQLGNLIKAEEALSVAARTMEFRSGAYTIMAGVAMQKQDFTRAGHYAQMSLDYNRNNLRAYEILGTSYRKSGNATQASKTYDTLLDIDPLNHYARFEQYLLLPTQDKLSTFNAGIQNELPHETYLELAMEYFHQGLEEESIKILEESPPYPTVSYWLAYLNREAFPEKSNAYLNQAEEISPELVFPFRLETIPVLNWAQKRSPSWKNLYYLGLIHWSKLGIDRAKELFKKCGDSPEFAPFYISRGILFQNDTLDDLYAGHNFKKANELNPKEWRTWHYLVDYSIRIGNFQQAERDAKKAYVLFTDNPVTGMDYAKALVKIGENQKSIQVLQDIYILPQEGAREGHDIYELAYLALALDLMEQGEYKKAIENIDESKNWPENLGAGKPFDPDTRLQDYIAAYIESQLGNQKQADQYYNKIVTYSLNPDHWNSQYILNNYLGIQVMQIMDKQEEVTRLFQNWQLTQDSLSNWNIAVGSSSPAFKWVSAKYQNKDSEAEEYKNRLMAENKFNRYDIFFKSVQNAKI